MADTNGQCGAELRRHIGFDIHGAAHQDNTPAMASLLDFANSETELSSVLGKSEKPRSAAPSSTHRKEDILDSRMPDEGCDDYGASSEPLLPGLW